MSTMNEMKDTGTLQVWTEERKASKEAIEFLSIIGPKEVDQCLFVDSLETVSDTGRQLGEFCLSVQKASYNDEPCYLVHANSHGAIDNIPCGTSITAYISRGLETLEENCDEHMKFQEHVLERKVHIVKQGAHLVVNKVITEKEEVKKQSFTFSLDSVQGFVSEASNLLILRILAQQKKIPDNMVFLSFDADTKLGMSTYRKLDAKKQKIGEEVVDVFGIERTVTSAEDNSATWINYFLSDGHLASRLQVGSPVTMNLLQLLPLLSVGLYFITLLQFLLKCIKTAPHRHICFPDERDQKPVFEKKPLVWQEDMELYSKFLDRKEELKADHFSYIRQHPELKTLLADFLQFLLLRKPQNVFSFAHDFFSSFASQPPPDSTFKTSET
ncbi:ciliogenesis-associated TTC17-interacting protein isoform X1 [Trichomycterus rosablanca]|uniref:ciliogenesis-associated TTC17-interacting protein isoform X1 n=1 Tax=Trichomycterus rosablanca TaxID=2290929 RepID=UPI002F354EC2